MLSSGATSRPASLQNGFLEPLNGRFRDECLLEAIWPVDRCLES